MRNEFGISAEWRGPWDEQAFTRWVQGLRSRLAAPAVSLGLVFISPQLADYSQEILEIIRVDGRTPLLAGCTGQSLVANESEFPDHPGLVLSLFHLPGAKLRGVHIAPETLHNITHASDWHTLTGVPHQQVNGWLVFTEPNQFNGEAWLRSWNLAYPGIPTVGGLASSTPGAKSELLFLNGESFDEGAVLIAVGGDVALEPITSQGCTPIGESWTITRADQNYILSIANRPAYTVLLDTFNALSIEEKSKAQNNLLVGFATSEYLDEYQRGDFLVRTLIGADPKNGVIAVGALPRPGQTVQFHRRDVGTATDDLSRRLQTAREKLHSRRIYGACLCICNGRGARFFGRPNHDSSLVQEQLGPLPVAGFFCNGEIGPVGDQTFLHGYTASLAVFVSKSPTPPPTRPIA